MSNVLAPLLTVHRAHLTFTGVEVRAVYRSALMEDCEVGSLVSILTNKAVEFYRPIDQIVRDLPSGFPLATFKDTLARVPTAGNFRSSHFGEILACVFAEEVLGLRRIYSKLSLLTAENANAYKMDLVLYDPLSNPMTLVFGEVKSSPKNASNGLPAGHDTSCYSDIFNSLRKYGDSDLAFDLAAARDRLAQLPEGDRERVREALMPYARHVIKYAAFAVIDDSTFDHSEAKVLATRKSPKTFEVDIVGATRYATSAEEVYDRLSGVLQALVRACS